MVLSVEMTGSEAFSSMMEGSQDPVGRARVVADLSLDAIPDALSLVHFQGEIEKSVGARVSLAGVSTLDVVEEIEDIMCGISGDVAMPCESVIRRKIRSVTRGSEYDVSDLISRIALELIEENRIGVV